MIFRPYRMLREFLLRSCPELVELNMPLLIGLNIGAIVSTALWMVFGAVDTPNEFYWRGAAPAFGFCAIGVAYYRPLRVTARHGERRKSFEFLSLFLATGLLGLVAFLPYISSKVVERRLNAAASEDQLRHDVKVFNRFLIYSQSLSVYAWSMKSFVMLDEGQVRDQEVQMALESKRYASAQDITRDLERLFEIAETYAPGAVSGKPSENRFAIAGQTMFEAFQREWSPYVVEGRRVYRPKDDPSFFDGRFSLLLALDDRQLSLALRSCAATKGLTRGDRKLLAGLTEWQYSVCLAFVAAALFHIGHHNGAKYVGVPGFLGVSPALATVLPWPSLALVTDTFSTVFVRVFVVVWGSAWAWALVLFLTKFPAIQISAVRIPILLPIPVLIGMLATAALDGFLAGTISHREDEFDVSWVLGNMWWTSIASLLYYLLSPVIREVAIREEARPGE